MRCRAFFLAFGWSLIGAAICPASASPAPWGCTQAPPSLWLPLHILQERLEEAGYRVLEAVSTHDSCYRFRLRGRGGVEREVTFDPVSARPIHP